MNIIRMSGGLGNQMFQYALYLKLISMGREVKFDDVTEYRLANARPIMLSVFGIDYPKASREEVIELTDASMRLSCRIRRKIFGRKSMEYREASVNFDGKVLEQENAYLCGNYQSEKYFREIEDRVREAFVFRNIEVPGETEELIRGYEEQMDACESASIHIRRGDYLDTSDVYGGICTDAYYHKAIGYLLEKNPETHFFVFSNDSFWAEKWCEAKAQEWEKSFTVIKGTDEETGYLDMMLMSRCKSHIIANSTFSWWGAWLNPRADKVVIAPSKWLNTCVCEDIYTPEMVRINAAGKINKEKEMDVVRKADEEKLLSIIVAVYNIEEYLPRCIESVLAQTYRKLEIILVDDGSTDESGRICDAYAGKDERIRVIHKKNGGLSDARNAGMDIASGEYIGFVDGDDWIEPDMYRAMYESCERECAQIAVCRYKQITKSGVVDASTGNSVSLSRAEALEIYVCGDERYLIYNSVWSKLFAAQLIREMRFPVGKKSEDIMFTTRAFCHMNRLVYLDTAYYNYVLDREGSIMNEKAGERRLKDELPFWREQIAYLRKEGMPKLADKAAYHFYRRLLFYYIDFKMSAETKGYAAEIIRQLREDRTVIGRIYRENYVAAGDRMRMKLALSLPEAYYLAVRLYDRYVIPIRNRGK